MTRGLMTWTQLLHHVEPLGWLTGTHLISNRTKPRCSVSSKKDEHVTYGPNWELSESKSRHY